MIWSTGGRYDGLFRNNKRHGQGKMIWCDGTTYEGQWVDGLQEGLGKLVYRDVIKIGIFLKNKFIKDQAFVFEGLNTGVYGTFLRNQLNERGAFNAPNVLMRSNTLTMVINQNIVEKNMKIKQRRKSVNYRMKAEINIIPKQMN